MSQRFKMDTVPSQKRPFEKVDQESSYPSKKPLQSLSEDGPLTQEDVVYFKKEAIWRQMKLYKSQAEQLSKELSRHEKRYQAFVAVHSLLEAWYGQVLKACDLDLDPSFDIDQDSVTIESTLKQRTEKLAGILKSVSGTIDANEDKEHIFDIVKASAERDSALNLKNDIEKRLAAAEESLANLRKEQLRRLSSSLQRVLANDRIKSEDETSLPAPDSSNGVHNGNGKVLNGKIENDHSSSAAAAAAAAISTEEKDELERLRIEAEELKACVEATNQSSKSLQEKLSDAESANNALKERLSNLTESDLSSSQEFIKLTTQNKSLQEHLSQITKTKDELVQKLSELESKSGDVAKMVNRELEEDNRLLRENLSRSENDLARIRTTRDELLAKQSILKLELDNKKTVEEVSKLNEILNDRLCKLEKSRQDDYTGENKVDFDSMEKEDLIKRINILSSGMEEIEVAFQNTRNITLDKMKSQVDHESLVKKLTIEKNKADQKYFATMRLKDSLSAENKVLKLQMTKSQELITKLNELEKTYLNKIEILTKSVNDYKVIKDMAIHENSKLQETLKLMGKSREAVSKELSEKKQTIETLGKKNNELTEELTSKSISHSKLEAKLKATDGLLQKYKQNNTSSILQEDEKQLEALRSITKCSVCSKNWKNMVITTCGHVFCNGCVQERLAARLRRCPTCNKGFSSNDLLSIHL